MSQNTQTLRVELGASGYPIYMGGGLLRNAEIFLAHLPGQQVLIVSDPLVAEHYLTPLQLTLQSKQCDTIILPAGEQHKNLATVNQIFDGLLSFKHARSTTLVALGGGVVGDTTGFAAACYMRGVNFIQVPTTLLAQVDAAIGGKTAVNHPLGKNMIGAFHQPKAVMVDLDTLNTLPDRVFHEGLAEVIKYGLIQDVKFFEWIEENLSSILQKNPLVLQEMIFRSCEIKARLVAADEREQGIRAQLNLGHTFGHAIENVLGYGKILHGEAVAIGTLMAADLSARMGCLDREQVARIKQLLTLAKLPITLPEGVSASQLLELMKGDKKNINLRLRLVLLRTIGEAVLTEEVPLEKLQQTLKHYAGQ